MAYNTRYAWETDDQFIDRVIQNKYVRPIRVGKAHGRVMYRIPVSNIMIYARAEWVNDRYIVTTSTSKDK